MTTTRALPTLTLCELGETGMEGFDSHSPFCIKVHRALRAAGLPYERRFASRPAAWKAHNPTGQVPVLLVGDEPVADSTRIVARISQLGRSLEAGPTGRERAEAWLWEELADTAVNGFVVASRWADARNWPAVRDAYFAEMPSLVRAIVPPRLRANVIATLVARDVWRAGEDECWRRFEALLDHLDARGVRDGLVADEQHRHLARRVVRLPRGGP